eukprot:3528126-Pyramimonas_sp.AAC.1
MDVKIIFARNLSFAQPTVEGALRGGELVCCAELVLAEARSERDQVVVVRRTTTLTPTATHETRSTMGSLSEQGLEAMSRANVNQPLPLREEPCVAAVD